MTRPNPIGIISMFYARPFGREHFDTFARMKQSGCDFVELLVPEPGELAWSHRRRVCRRLAACRRGGRLWRVAVDVA